MSVVSPSWLELLQGEELAHLAASRRDGHDGAVPGRPRPARASALVGRGSTRSTPSAEAWEALRAGGTRSSRPAPRAARRSPSTCPCSTRSRASRRGARSTSTRPRRSPRIRRARCAAFGVQRRQGGDLRRRHGERAALADPQVGERDPDQPGHAPRRRAPAPRPLGRRAREPPLRRRRRGARLPRRLRLARRERPSAAAAARARLRLRAAVPARVRDDREPRRARRVAARRAGDAWSTATPRRAPSGRSPLEPAAHRRRARCARERARRGVAPARGLVRAASGRSASRRAARRRSSIHRFAAERLDRRLPRGSRRTAPATRRRSGARSSGG